MSWRRADISDARKCNSQIRPSAIRRKLVKLLIGDAGVNGEREGGREKWRHRGRE
jgi:hypothetical protein